MPIFPEKQKGIKMKIFVGFFLILTTPAYAQMFENLFHHHLHNFAINDEMAFHAKAMGYSLICESKPDDPLYDDIGLIKLQNARVGPVRIYIEKASGEVHVRYHKRTLLFDSRLHAIADLYGLERIEGKIYPITEDDWFIVKSYSAAVKNVSGLTVDDLDESVFEDCFVKTWTLEDNEYRSFNLAANWQSKKWLTIMLKCLQQKRIGGNMAPFSGTASATGMLRMPQTRILAVKDRIPRVVKANST